MAFSYPKHVSTKQTPQSEPILGKQQVKNSAGGFVFAVDDWVRLERFLILGSEGGTYYVSEKKLTKENAEVVLRCAKLDAVRTVNTIVQVSDAGRAPKNDPAIFALALVAGLGEPEARKLALDNLSKVCRIGTHLFHFNEAVEGLRGRGRQLNRAVANWYLEKEPKDLAYQCVKYQSRDKWSHRDLLRLCKPKPINPLHNRIFGWVVGKIKEEKLLGIDALMPIVAFEHAKKSTDKIEIARLIRDHNLPRECIPTQFLKEAVVWEALLEKMPMTAIIRNLATMTRIGVLAPLSNGVGRVLSQLTNTEALKKARIHPVAVLMALKTYAQGHGEKGQNSWVPVPQIIDALDGAFYRAFAAVEPTGKRFLLGVDVSGSMSSNCAGTPLSCCEGATAMALTIAHTEPRYMICGFADTFRTLPITARSRLDDALRCTRDQNFGRTDCSLPMVYAMKEKVPVDCFVVLTDNETWSGPIHPCQALVEYRQKMGIGAKLCVVGMTATEFSIADQNDSGMLDVAGFDTSVPNVLADFARQ